MLNFLTAGRLSLLYAAFFVVIGIQLPFWPMWLASRGLGPTEIGTIISVGVVVKILGNPLFAHMADRRGERRRLMVALAAGALGFFALFFLTSGFWSILAVTVAYLAVWSAIMPLGESLTMLTARENNLDYGRIRLWGSLSFIVAAVLVGRVLVSESIDIIYWLLLAAIAVTVVACFLLPDTRPPRAAASGLPIGVVLRDRTFLLFMAAAAFIQGSHGVYYAFGTLHWKSVGYSEDVIGWLWAEGVIAEIILFAFGAALVRRLGPAGLMVLGGGAATLRWGVTGLSDALPVLAVVQALHALTFGATHLGAIHFISRAMPPALSATAQSVYAAVVMGMGMGVSIFASGKLYALFGGAAYLAMGGMGVSGCVLAVFLMRRWKAC
jgi:MFS transporter, PPP family, 3-phenylpropionic acid transporter